MIDYSQIKLTPAEESHREFSDAIKEAAYRGYIEEIWGWEDSFQREYNDRNWKERRPQIIRYSDRPIGTIYVNEDEESIEIAQFILISEYQNQGIGTYILKDITARADLSNRVIKLDYLRQNPAASLYRRTGFRIVAEDDILIRAERKPGGKT